jgi:O-methyltransferase involved in polyketide biosynthesis
LIISTFYTDRLEKYDFGRVSVTAMGPVIGRGEGTSIPFAKEMLSCLEGRSQGPAGEFLKGARAHAAFFEARFKAVSRLLLERRAGQILELASGFSPRGLDPSFASATFVEVDLPAMIEQKREIVIELLGAIPGHLKFCRASVLQYDELAHGLAYFRQEPVAVTSEGLLRYLTFEEKKQLAANVRKILSVYGGMWVTPDIHLKKWAPENKMRDGVGGNLLAQLGRDIRGNYFEDFDHARSFFEGCGFQVEERPLLEGIRQSVLTLPMASEELLEELQNRRIYVMT